jgi:hypothetical protein
MSKSSITVRDVFELPEKGADSSEGWKSFQESVSKEVKGIKTAALPDVAKKVAELFEIPIPDIFLTSWRKANSIQALLDESRKTPETIMNAELGEHTINSLHRPHIEIRIQNKSVKKIEFVLKLTFNLKGFVLKIQNGAIRGMQTGMCEVKGKLEYKDLVIAEKKLAPITLPELVSFEGSTNEPQPEAKGASATTLAETKEASTETERRPEALVGEAQKTVEEIEKRKAPDMIAAEGPQTSSPVEAVEEPKPIETTGTASQQPGGTAEQTEERTTWEVGDEEEDFGAKQEATENAARDASSGGSETAESHQEVIDRMSRELADSRKTGGEISELGGSAKAAP